MKVLKIILSTAAIAGISLTVLSATAYAAVTGLSFGGKLFVPYPCTCTGGSVYYFVSPYFGTLAYTVGSQTRSKFTLPKGTQILGLYNPFITEACWMGVEPYCTVLPTKGMIMPMVGNSI